MKGTLNGQRILVTGGASGIGRAIAIACAREGAHVGILDRAPQPQCAEVVREMLAHRGHGFALHMDVTDEAAVTGGVSDAVERLGGLDAAFSCAGVILEQSLLATSLEDYERVMAVNVRGTFLFGREVLRLMSAARAGRLVNVSSDLAYIGREEFSVYCASKGAVISLTRAWAREFAPHVLVNALAPGPIDTPLLALENMSPQWREKETQNPLGRVGQPEEVAALAVFLAGPGATFITGQCLGPNGGSCMP